MKTCIVIGNGPSLRGFDLHRLNGFSTLGMNAAYRHWDRIGWYPDYYACLDDQLIRTHHAEIERLYANGLVRKIFVHGLFFKYHPHRLGHPDFTSLDQTSEHWYHENGKALGLTPIYTRPAFRMSDPSKITTGSHSVRYVADLGYDRVALLGIDLRYVEILPEAEATSEIGLIMKETPKLNPNYFFDDYQKAGDLFNIPNPAVHDGQLHPRSFELIATDFRENDVACVVYNSNRQSILSERDVFPFHPIEELLSESALGSVMVPCNKREVDTIIANFGLWGRLEFSPAEQLPVKNRPVLVFVFNNASARADRGRIEKAFYLNGMQRYFKAICFEYLDLEGDRDVYIRDYTQPVGEQGYKAGPNNQFFCALRRVAKYGRYTFLMETDCLPIRRGWLTRLQRLIDASEPFWVMGSAYRGVEKLGKDYLRHINGNAVYAAGDPAFQSFVTDFWEYHTWRLVREKDKRLAYDCILEIMFSPENMREPDVMNTWKKTAHFFRYVDYLQNISGNTDIEKADGSMVATLRRTSPDTYILHNRAVHAILLERLARTNTGGDISLVKDGAFGYPRILLIDSTSAGNGTATGEIKAALFSDWPKAGFLQISRHGTSGLGEVSVADGNFVHTAITPEQDWAKIVASACASIDRFAPDVVLYRPAPDALPLHRFAMTEIRRLQKPLVTWIMDDWPARMAVEDAETWAWMERDLNELLERSVTRLSISEEMSEAFVRRYGVPFRPLANGVDPGDWPIISRPARDDFLLRYAGGLANDMNRQSVLRVAAAVDKLARRGAKIRFEISTQPWWLQQCKDLFSDFGSTSIELSNRTIPEYRLWLSEADALLIAYNFDEDSLRYIRYSMSNKLPECMASGAPILAHGPRAAASIAYLARTETAKIVESPDERTIVQALEELVANPRLRGTLAEAGRRNAFSEHNIHFVRSKLLTVLERAARAFVAPALVKPAHALSLRGPKDLRMALQSCATYMLLDPVAGVKALSTDEELARNVSIALADLPEGNAMKIHFEKVRAWAIARSSKDGAHHTSARVRPRQKTFYFLDRKDNP